jgi:hypothetical protein
LSTETTDRQALDVGGLCIAGLALLGAAALLAPGGAEGTLRTVAGVLAVLAIPGWLIGRLTDEEGDAIGRLLGGTVATLAVVALCGFASFELGLRVATAAFAVPLLIVFAIVAVLTTAHPRAPRARLWPLLAALGLGAATLLGALGVHLVLPAVPIEPAFSIAAPRVVASPSGVVVTVTVHQVHTHEPTELSVYVGVRFVATKLVAPGQRRITLTARLPAGTSTCPKSVRIVAPNNAFLTPPVACVGW